MSKSYVYLPNSLTHGRDNLTITRNQLADNMIVEGSVSKTLSNLKAYIGLNEYGNILTTNQAKLVRA